MEFLFPHNEPRKIQKGFMNQVYATIKNKSQILVHGPTGIGKTASALSPALTYILNENPKKIIFFLTSRNTQHLIAVETLRKIRNKYDKMFVTVDLVGKKGMCNQAGIQLLSSSEFSEYCKDIREKGRCEYFNNLKSKNKASVRLVHTLDKLKEDSPMHVEEIKSVCENAELCSYEVACTLGKKAQVIIADYNYILNPHIRDTLLRKINKNLDDIIVVFDEGHNIPNRARDLLTANLNTFILDAAAKEAKLMGFEDMADDIISIKHVIEKLVKKYVPIAKYEAKITKKDFFTMVEEIGNWEELMGNFVFISDQVLEKKRRSFCASVAGFMENWTGQEEGFTRILSKSFTKNGRVMLSLSYRCLDPALVMKDIVDQTHAIIVMSGTLTPIDMYADLLGLNPSEILSIEYENPFPKENKLSLIVPGTSTKYKLRNELMFKTIAKKCAEVTNTVPGNSVIFFPSYKLRNDIYEFLRDYSDKTMFLEETEYTNEQRGNLLERFKDYKDSGAVLLGVAGGSFAEGIDLPGDLLKAVIVVGLPLGRPDLETKELIDYYDRRFGRGWDYGYVFPAIIKIMQSSGRCIRSETDRGIVIFMDDRYTWQSYKRCFPHDMHMQVKNEPKEMISNFFNEKV